MELKYKLYDNESNKQRIADAGECGERTIKRGRGIQTYCVLSTFLFVFVGVASIVFTEGKDIGLISYGLTLILASTALYPLSGLGKLVEAQGFVLLSRTREEMKEPSMGS